MAFYEGTIPPINPTQYNVLFGFNMVDVNHYWDGVIMIMEVSMIKMTGPWPIYRPDITYG